MKPMFIVKLFKILSFGWALISFSFYSSAAVTFYVTLDTELPEDEYVSFSGNHRPFADFFVSYPMTKVSENTWMLKVDYLKISDTFQYRYGRNSDPSGGGENLNDKELDCCIYRTLTVSENNQVVDDIIRGWRWLDSETNNFLLDDSEHTVVKPDNLNEDFMSGVQLLDYWRPEWMLPLPSTLDRIKNTVNANWVQFTPVPHISEFTPLPKINLFDHWNATPDSHLRQMLNAAKDQKLKIYLRPLIWVADGSLDYPDKNERDSEWWNEYFKYVEPIYIYYAEIAQEFEIDILGFDPLHEQYKLSDDDLRITNSLVSNLLGEIKSIYKGKIATQFQGFSVDLDIFGQVDYLSGKFWEHQLSTENSNSLSIEVMREIFETNLENQFKKASEKWNKPILINEIASASYKGGIKNDPSWVTQETWKPDDPNVPLDLQGQANVYEAFMASLTNKEWIAGAFSFAYYQWSHQDKTPSIRGKPSEKVLSKWYQWLNTREINDSPYLPPFNLTAQVEGKTVYLSWQNNITAKNTFVYYGLKAGKYIGKVNLGTKDRVRIKNVPKGEYFVAVSSGYDDSVESLFSEEISVGVGRSHTLTPRNFHALYHDNKLILNWRPTSDASKYYLNYGYEENSLNEKLQLKDKWGQDNVFETRLNDFPSGTYYLAVSAENSEGNKSRLSNKIRITIP
jgi:hypothetical protein